MQNNTEKMLTFRVHNEKEFNRILDYLKNKGYSWASGQDLSSQRNVYYEKFLSNTVIIARPEDYHTKEVYYGSYLLEDTRTLIKNNLDTHYGNINYFIKHEELLEWE